MQGVDEWAIDGVQEEQSSLVASRINGSTDTNAGDDVLTNKLAARQARASAVHCSYSRQCEKVDRLPRPLLRMDF